MNSKTILSFLIAAIALVAPVPALAHVFEARNSDGVMIYYVNVSPNTVAVSYRGNSPGQYLDEYVGTVNIPSKVTNGGVTYSVTGIDEKAFSGCSQLTSVTIPNSVTKIGSLAFNLCSNLASVEIGNGVSEIGEQAFANCQKLGAVTLPSSLKKIGKWAFTYCTSLKTIDIPDSVETMEFGVFVQCTGLESARVGDSVTTFDGAIFSGCTSLVNVYLGRSITTLESDTFNNCQSLGSVTVPESVTSIANYCFEGCSAMTYLYIPRSVTSLGFNMLYQCTRMSSLFVNNPEPTNIALACKGSNTPFYAMPVDKCTLYVPRGAKGAYENTAIWRDFADIQEYDFPDPEDPDIDPNRPLDDNRLYAADVTAEKNNPTEIEVSMANEAAITAFQCDIIVPEGIAFNLYEGDPDVYGGDRDSRSHTITADFMDDNTVRVLGYSTRTAPYSDNDGVLFRFAVVASGASGTYKIKIKNIELTDTTEHSYRPGAFAFGVEVVDFTAGDANGDGSTTIADVVAITNHILGHTPENFVALAADVNGDGNITVTDVVATVNIVLRD